PRRCRRRRLGDEQRGTQREDTFMLRLLSSAIIGAVLGAAFTYAWLAGGVPGQQSGGLATAGIDAGDAATVLEPTMSPAEDRAAPVVDALVRRASWEPEQSAARALALTDGRERYVALRGVARAWAERDPAAALAYGAALGNAV